MTPRTGDYPCGTLAAEILAPDPLGPLLFVAHGPSHQLSYEYERELQAVAAARMVEELADRVGRAMWWWEATSTRTRAPAAWRFGAANDHWRT